MQLQLPLEKVPNQLLSSTSSPSLRILDHDDNQWFPPPPTAMCTSASCIELCTDVVPIENYDSALPGDHAEGKVVNITPPVTDRIVTTQYSPPVSAVASSTKASPSITPNNK